MRATRLLSLSIVLFLSSTLIAISLIMLDLSEVSAADCTVPTAYATIQAAVDDNSCNSIIIEAGTYTENVFIGRSLTVRGLGRDITIVDGGGLHSVFDIRGGTQVTLSSMTIRNGRNEYGGGIVSRNNFRTDLRLLSLDILNNEATLSGGGIFLSDTGEHSASLTMIDCLVAHNTSGGSGGGVTAFGEVEIGQSTISNNAALTIGGGLNVAGFSTISTPSISIVDVLVSNNSAARAAGIYSSGANIYESIIQSNTGTGIEGVGDYPTTIVNSTILSNTERGALNVSIYNSTVRGNLGGGVFGSFIYNSLIISNSTDLNGGGIDESFIYDSSIIGNIAKSGGGANGSTIIRTLIENNTATESGGGAYNSRQIENSTLQFNHADGNGGGGAFDDMIDNSSVLSNTAAQNGGGLYRPGSVVETDISYNSSLNGGGIYQDGNWLPFHTIRLENNQASNHGGGLYAGNQTVFSHTQFPTPHGIIIKNNIAGANGGGIYFEARTNPAMLDSYALIGNIAFSGGALFSATDSELISITNSTLSHNHADTIGAANNATLHHSTVYSNTTLSVTSAAIVSSTLINTIVANNQGGDCSGPIVTLGKNLDSDSTCNTTLTNEPNLGMLESAAGTLFHVPNENSPLIHAADIVFCLDQDQRNFGRSLDSPCDIGSIEATPRLPIASITPLPFQVSEGSFAEIPISLEYPPLSTGSLRYSTRDGTALAGTDYISQSGVLTFSMGETEATIIIPIINDQTVEPTKFFTVTLTDTVGILMPYEQFRVEIIDDEQQYVSLQHFEIMVGEATGTGSIPITVSLLFQHNDDVLVTVDYLFYDVGAKLGQDYNIVPNQGTIAFAPNEMEKVLTVDILDDEIYEGDESFVIRLSNPSQAQLTAPTEMKIIIRDERPTVYLPYLVK